MDPEPGNWSFTVSTKFSCDEIGQGTEIISPDPLRRVTTLGCKLLDLLQDMYHFGMIYVPPDETQLEGNSTQVDIYASALALSPQLLDFAWPIEAIIDRRYGFLLCNVEQVVTARAYYNLPFSSQTWRGLFLMTFLVIAPILYLLCKWEERVVRARQEYSLVYELMVIIGVCCQHIPPIRVSLLSRRIAYFAFLMSSWLVYTYYSSNLLSHLVNDREGAMTLAQLANSEHHLLVLNSLQINNSGLPWFASGYETTPEYEKMMKKYRAARQVNIAEGITAIGTQRAALLSDFITIYPYMKTYLDNAAICELKEINLLTNIKEYMHTSKTFPLKEHFKIGLLKIKEFGLLKRLKHDHVYSAPKCQQDVTQDSYACFEQIVGPLFVLAGAFLASAILLCMERAYYVYERNQKMKALNLPASQKGLKKALWLLSTSRNALVVIVCSLIAFIYERSFLESPFKLTGTVR